MMNSVNINLLNISMFVSIIVSMLAFRCLELQLLILFIISLSDDYFLN